MKNFILIASIFFLTACDNPPKSHAKAVEDNSKPFGLAGVRLGSKKEELRGGTEIYSCTSKTNSVAECYIGGPSSRIIFFGAETQSETVELHDPYTNVDAISFYFTGHPPSRYDIENTWILHGKCLSGNEIDRIVEKSPDSAASITRTALNAYDLISPGDGFICIGDEREFMKLSKDSYDKEGGAVRIFYLRDDIFEKIKYLLDLKNEADSAELAQRRAILGADQH